MLQEGVGELKSNVPVLLVLNKRDLIKPGEMAKKLEVRNAFIDYVSARQLLVYASYNVI